jgi:hypothetical protein
MIDEVVQTVSHFVLTMTRMKRPAMPMIPQPVAKYRAGKLDSRADRRLCMAMWTTMSFMQAICKDERGRSGSERDTGSVSYFVRVRTLSYLVMLHFELLPLPSIACTGNEAVARGQGRIMASNRNKNDREDVACALPPGF